MAVKAKTNKKTDKTIKTKKKYLIICSGGNAPGMANCILAFTKKCLERNIQPWAAANGFTGVHDRRWWILNPNVTQRAVTDGSAFIGTSRCPQFVNDIKYRNQVAKNIADAGFSCVFVVGGEGSYKGAYELTKYGIHVITIPATIDNDVASTQFTVGFDTCLNKTCDAVSDITDCFISHQGVALIEIMGRHCPDLTVRTAIACNSTYMVTKYSRLKTPHEFYEVVQEGLRHGKFNINFIITEKLYGTEGYPDLKDIAKYIQEKTGLMSRHVVVGYLQRGGKPSARDRLLANYMIDQGVELARRGKYNKAMCYVKRRVFGIDLQKAINAKRRSSNKDLVRRFNSINRF